MMSLLRKSIGTIISLVMLLTMFLVPQYSLARSPTMIDEGGPGGPGGGEGDPLDSNDYDIGGGDGDVHNNRIIPGHSDDHILSILDSGQMLILRVDYLGDIPVFTVQIVSAEEFRLETSYVR